MKCRISTSHEKSIKKPPKKRLAVRIHISKIDEYSARKKKTKITAACSVMNPETNSDSASAKSKGALLVSAIAPIKNIYNIGSNGKANQTIFWNSTFAFKFKLLVIIIITIITELSINS